MPIDPRYTLYKKRYFERYHAKGLKSLDQYQHYQRMAGATDNDYDERLGGDETSDATKFAATSFTKTEQDDMTKLWSIFAVDSTADLEIMEATDTQLQTRKERFQSAVRRLGENVSSLLISVMSEAQTVIQESVIQPMSERKLNFSKDGAKWLIGAKDSKDFHLATLAIEGLDTYMKQVQTLFVFFAKPDITRDELRSTTQKWISDTFGETLLTRWREASNRLDMLRVYLRNAHKHPKLVWLSHFAAVWKMVPVVNGSTNDSKSGGDEFDNETISEPPSFASDGGISPTKSSFITNAMKTISWCLLRFAGHTILDLLWIGSLSNFNGQGLELIRGAIEPTLKTMPALKFWIDLLVGRVEATDVTVENTVAAVSAVDLSYFGEATVGFAKYLGSAALKGLEAASYVSGLVQSITGTAATATSTVTVYKFVPGFALQLSNYINTTLGVWLGQSTGVLASAVKFVGGWVWTGLQYFLGTVSTETVLKLSLIFLAASVFVKVIHLGWNVFRASKTIISAGSKTWSLLVHVYDALLVRKPTQEELTTLSKGGTMMDEEHDSASFEPFRTHPRSRTSISRVVSNPVRRSNRLLIRL